MGKHRKKAKIRRFHLALNTLLGLNELNYCLLMAYICLFMNFAPNEHPLAYCQLRQSKFFLSYQHHNASVIHLLKLFATQESVPIVDKLTLSVYHLQLTR
jgi:hypothetical protein